MATASRIFKLKAGGLPLAGLIPRLPANLRNPPVAAEFARNIGFTDAAEIDKLARAMASHEEDLHGIRTDKTLLDLASRSAACMGGPERLRRYAEIVEEILNLRQRDKSPSASTSSWGGLPNVDVPRGSRGERQVFFVIGGPGSGKSSLAKPLCESAHAVLIDSDDVKEKLPEFEGGKGAHLVQDESSHVIEMPNGILACAMHERMSLVYPKVGKTEEKLLADMERFNKAGYNAHLVLVACDLKEATHRVMKRFLSHSRYVSPRYVCERVGQNPELVYVRVRKNGWESYSAYDASKRGVPPVCLERSEYAPDLSAIL